jgi:hypothetical protein
MAKGIKARYMMPVLSALAGRSPICWAVFVQMEHCAVAVAEKISNIIKTGNIKRHFFIFLEGAKYTQKRNRARRKKSASARSRERINLPTTLKKHLI